MQQTYSKNTMDINTYILAKAMQNKICTPWAEKISNAASVDELLTMYVAGIDFCLEHNFPSNTDLVNLGGDHINQYGIYVDQAVKLVDRPFVVFLGASKGNARYTGFMTGQIFLKHHSSIEMEIKDNSFVVIDCFDDSNLILHVSDQGKALVNVYEGAQVKTTYTGNGVIKIVEKLKKSY